jgi:TPR repeat protein
MTPQLLIECPLCSEDKSLMRVCHMCCCGQDICIKCQEKWMLKDAAKVHGEDRGTCPFCRKPHYTDEERDLLLKAHMEAGKSWAFYNEAGSHIDNNRFVKSRELLLKAREGGEKRSLIYLGRHYEMVEPSVDEAIKYYSEGSDAGIEMCSFNLAMLYFNRNDTVKALHYMNVAAHQKSEPAHHTLGRWYLEGVCGLAVDVEKGLELLTLSADSGYSSSHLQLGIFYFHRGPKQSIEQSLKYLFKSLLSLDKKTLEKKKSSEIYLTNYEDSVDFKQALFYIGMGCLMSGDAELIPYYWLRRYLSTHPVGPKEMVTSTRTLVDDIAKSINSKCATCSKKVESLPFKICGGCHVARFCSKKCHAELWKDHKDLCNEMKTFL